MTKKRKNAALKQELCDELAAISLVEDAIGAALNAPLPSGKVLPEGATKEWLLSLGESLRAEKEDVKERIDEIR